jgi:hypothetical protein
MARALLLALALALARVAPRLLGARMLSLAEAMAALRGGADVAAWGGVLLTGGIAEDASPQALAVLRLAARHVRARSSCSTLSALALAPASGGVVSAAVVYSETGEGPTTIAVAIAGQPEGLGWDEIPSLGRLYAVSLRVNASGCGSAGGEGLQEHNLTLSLSIPDADVNVMAHTWAAVAAEEGGAVAAVGVGADGSVRGSSASASAAGGAAPLRVLSYNTWNVNPPKWLHRDHRDRFRAYALRMHALGDLARQAAAGVIAFQEVRYDSTLGGFGDAAQTASPWASGARSGPAVPTVPADAPAAPAPPLPPAPQLYAAALAAVEAEAADPAAAVHAAMPAVSRSTPYSLAVAWAVSSLWWNKTMGEISQSDAYRARNAEKWAAVTAAPGWALYGGSAHPLEGEEAPRAGQQQQQQQQGEGSQEEGNSSSSGSGSGSAGPAGRSPYTKPPPAGPRSWSEAQATFLDHPHAQVRALGCGWRPPALLFLRARARAHLPPTPHPRRLSTWPQRCPATSTCTCPRSCTWTRACGALPRRPGAAPCSATRRAPPSLAPSPLCTATTCCCRATRATRATRTSACACTQWWTPRPPRPRARARWWTSTLSTSASQRRRATAPSQRCWPLSRPARAGSTWC